MSGRSAATQYFYFPDDWDVGDQEYEQASQVGESVMIDEDEKGGKLVL